MANPGGGPGPAPYPYKCLRCSKPELCSKIYEKCHMIVNFPSFYLTFFKIW